MKKVPPLPSQRLKIAAVSVVAFAILLQLARSLLWWQSQAMNTSSVLLATAFAFALVLLVYGAIMHHIGLETGKGKIMRAMKLPKHQFEEEYVRSPE